MATAREAKVQGAGQRRWAEVLLAVALLSLSGTLLAAVFACSVADLTSGSVPDAAMDAPTGPLEASAAEDGGDDGSDAVPQGGSGDAGAASADAAAGSDVIWDASSWDAPTGPVLLQNALHGEYLDVAGASLSDNAQVVTSTFTGRNDQYWTFKAMGDTSYEIVNLASSKCLDDTGGLVAPGTSMIQFTCSANTNQRWYLVNNQGSLTIVGQLSGRCLASQSLANPDVVIIGDCSTTSLSQQWHIPH